MSQKNTLVLEAVDTAGAAVSSRSVPERGEGERAGVYVCEGVCERDSSGTHLGQLRRREPSLQYLSNLSHGTDGGHMNAM